MNPESNVETFLAVVNDEEQYSIWSAYRELPAGWRPAGKAGGREECLSWIEKVWTDMRPLSLRKEMERQAEASVSGSQES